MASPQTEMESAPGKWSVIIIASILGAGLLIGSIWSLSHALSNSSSKASNATPDEAAAPDSGLTEEEIEKHDMAEQAAADLSRAAAPTQAVVIPAPLARSEIKLKKARAKVNQRVVEQLKQYVREHPELDTRDVQEQIKKRESRNAQIK